MSKAAPDKQAVLLDTAFIYFQQFLPITKNELEALISFCEIRTFDRRAIVVAEGETDQYLNMVLKGLVMKYVKVKNSEVILQLATEGHIIHSELSFLRQTPSPVQLQTLERTIMISLSYENMQLALEHFPQGEMLGRKILETMYMKKDERKYAWQSKTMRQRFLDYIQVHPHMLQRVPQKYLASYLHIKAETFSRLKHLVK